MVRSKVPVEVIRAMDGLTGNNFVDVPLTGERCAPARDQFNYYEATGHGFDQSVCNAFAAYAAEISDDASYDEALMYECGYNGDSDDCYDVDAHMLMDYEWGIPVVVNSPLKKLDKDLDPASRLPYYCFLKKDEVVVDQSTLRRLKLLFPRLVNERDFDLEALRGGFHNVMNVLYSLQWCKDHPMMPVQSLFMYLDKAINYGYTLPRLGGLGKIKIAPCGGALRYWLKDFKLFAKVFGGPRFKQTWFYRLYLCYMKFYFKDRYNQAEVVLRGQIHVEAHMMASLMRQSVEDAVNVVGDAVEKKVEAKLDGVVDAVTVAVSNKVSASISDFIANWPSKLGGWVSALADSTGSEAFKTVVDYFGAMYDKVKSMIASVWTSFGGSDTGNICSILTLLVFFLGIYAAVKTFKFGWDFTSLVISYYVKHQLGFSINRSFVENLALLGGGYVDAHGLSDNMFGAVTVIGSIVVCLLNPKIGSALNVAANLVMRSGPAMDTLSDHIIGVVDSVWFKLSEWGTGEGSHIFTSRSKVDEFENYLTEIREFLTTPQIEDKVMTDPVKTKILARLVTQGSDLKFAMTQVKGPLAGQYIKMYENLRMLHARALAVADMYKNRIETICVWLSGAPGKGKSTMLNAFPEAVHKLLQKEFGKEEYPDYTPGMKYERTKGSDYWEAYAGQLYCCKNEILAQRDAKVCASEAVEILNMCEDSVFPLNMAFGEKGKAFFRSEFFFTTTNMPDSGLSQIGINNDDALVRRRTFPLHVLRGETLKSDFSNIDKAWRFRFVKPTIQKYVDVTYLGLSRYLQISPATDEFKEGVLYSAMIRKGYYDFTFTEIVAAMFKEVCFRKRKPFRGSFLKDFDIPLTSPVFMDAEGTVPSWREIGVVPVNSVFEKPVNPFKAVLKAEKLQAKKDKEEVRRVKLQFLHEGLLTEKAKERFLKEEALLDEFRVEETLREETLKVERSNEPDRTWGYTMKKLGSVVNAKNIESQVALNLYQMFVPGAGGVAKTPVVSSDFSSSSSSESVLVEDCDEDFVPVTDTVSMTYEAEAQMMLGYHARKWAEKATDFSLRYVPGLAYVTSANPTEGDESVIHHLDESTFLPGIIAKDSVKIGDDLVSNITVNARGGEEASIGDLLRYFVNGPVIDKINYEALHRIFDATRVTIPYYGALHSPDFIPIHLYDYAGFSNPVSREAVLKFISNRHSNVWNRYPEYMFVTFLDNIYLSDAKSARSVLRAATKVLNSGPSSLSERLEKFFKFLPSSFVRDFAPEECSYFENMEEEVSCVQFDIHSGLFAVQEVGGFRAYLSCFTSWVLGCLRGGVASETVAIVKYQMKHALGGIGKTLYNRSLMPILDTWDEDVTINWAVGIEDAPLWRKFTDSCLGNVYSMQEWLQSSDIGKYLYYGGMIMSVLGACLGTYFGLKKIYQGTQEGVSKKHLNDPVSHSYRHFYNGVFGIEDQHVPKFDSQGRSSNSLVNQWNIDSLSNPLNLPEGVSYKYDNPFTWKMIAGQSDVSRHAPKPQNVNPFVSGQSDMSRNAPRPQNVNPFVSGHSDVSRHAPRPREVNPYVDAHGFIDDASGKLNRVGTNIRKIRLTFPGGQTVHTGCTIVDSYVLCVTGHNFKFAGDDFSKLEMLGLNDVVTFSCTRAQVMIKYLDVPNSNGMRDLSLIFINPAVQGQAYHSLYNYLPEDAGHVPGTKLGRIFYQVNQDRANVICNIGSDRTVVKTVQGAPNVLRAKYQDIHGEMHFAHTWNFVMVHNAEAEKGDCGYPYVNLDQSSGSVYVEGIHIAGAGCDAYFAPLYKSDLRQQYNWRSRRWEDAHGDAVAQSNHVPRGVYISDMLERQIDLNVDHVFIPDGSHYYGRIRSSNFMPSKTCFVPSVFNRPEGQQSLYPLEEAPAALCPFVNDDGEVISPKLKAMKKMTASDKTSPMPDWVTGLMASHPEALCDGFFGHGMLKSQLKRFTLEEAVFGIPGKMDSIDLTTSEGFYLRAFRLKRKDVIRFPSIDEPMGFIHPLVRQEIDRIHEAVRNGLLPKLITIGCLKDELRDLERVFDGKTRLFHVGDFVHMLWTRMVMGDLICYLKAHRFQTTCAIGTNPHGVDWGIWFAQMSAVSDPVFGGGDYGNYDMSIRSQFGWYLGECCANFYGYNTDSLEYREVLYACISSTAPLLILGRDVYWMNWMNPSGGYLTGFLNSFVNNVIFCILFMKFRQQCRDLKCDCGMSDAEFRDFWKLFYGDDNIFVVTRAWSKHFNMISISSEIEKLFGMTYTLADKSVVSEGDVDIKDIEFLKRKFGSIQGFYLFAPLDQMSIRSMLMWIRDTGSVQGNVEQLETNIRVSSMEMSYYGREAWESWANEVRSFCRRYNVNFTGGTFDAEAYRHAVNYSR